MIMEGMRIRGGKPLQGKINISGAKNSALKLMAASLLTDEPLTLSNIPLLADITTMANLLSQHGVQLTVNGDHQNNGHIGRVMELKARDITNVTAPYDIVRRMRASTAVLGPLLARCRKARVSLPGGCALGSRPVNLHIAALEQMGAEITLDGGYIDAVAPNGLHGAEIIFHS
jgi:UDP-N-acetylglucosamine 1-carboxyvinyltransferase